MTAPEPATVPDAATLEAVDRWVDFRLWHTRTPGAQVALGVGGVPFFSRAYGYADLEGAVAMTPGHLFRIASHSKTFTATLVLQLVERGRLGLDDALGQHVPALAGEPIGGVVVRELLEHTAGILRDGRDADYWMATRPFPDTDALLAMAREGGLKTAPGERFAYSNVGYSLLGLVVEAVRGESFADAARHGVTEPLGLADTVADYWRARAGDYAVGHSGLHTGPRRRPLEHVGTGAMAAATGFTSTAADLVTYFGAHVLGDERLLADRTKRLQQRLANAGDPRTDNGSGYGWGMIREKVDDQVFVGHSGGYPGHITKTLVDPASGLTIVVLTNAIDGPATPLARGIAQILAAAAEAGEEPTPSAHGWTGRYANPWGVLDIASVGGRLRTVASTEWAPVEARDELVEDGDRLLIEDGVGYGSVGEPVTRTPGGGLRYGGMSFQPLPDLPGGPEHRLGAA
ncbi:MAG: Beta-lactamase class C-like and penicillin binding proteins (PBPs) superfamily [uncultured Friedmanniella sp.]|uniref:Beta-lactamase class C-like and penicillin binding proteins (PBPs) superfamily n=1 Tax=uncultured Friedmanniella sp. TaxID=335381 RepID=A0A6J4K7A3_9ACTN|nr:MAG: Beta-lactamase class C-like and penicillin binding proteins (PBPs) superfamily [uncultured Friedmanniella sp.]